MKKTIIPFSLLVFTLVFSVACGGSKNKVQDQAPVVQPVVVQDTIKEAPEKIPLNPIQKKYGKLLGVAPEEVENIPLYEFVDEWMGVPYLLGGENEKGIDCSAFTQQLYVHIYDYLPERTAQKQYDAESTDLFKGQNNLREGDMLFFKRPKVKNRKAITHVGIYLKNDMFISASGYKGPEDIRGVKISDLNDPWWQERFIAAGRKPLDMYEVKTK